jgi:glycosyltransferase involved in cell wall biosynthesis
MSVTYSSQFFEVCRELCAEGYVISSYGKKDFVRDSQFLIEHRPIPWSKASGILYHLGQVWYGLQLITSALSYKANFAVIDSGTTHWFMLSFLSCFGVKVIPSLHCVLWRKYNSQGLMERLILKLNRKLFAHQCIAILSLSKDISKQVVELTDGEYRTLVQYLPSYKQIDFASIGVLDHQRSPFRVLFAGRIERDKGVLDLLEIAKRFLVEGRESIKFDICGEGSALEPLRLAAQQAKVDSFFVCHGHCGKLQMQKMFNHAHVVIVPTKTEFVEGLNRVVIEGVLSARPVVTSAVCPALSYVKDAVVEVLPDDVKAYGDALIELCHDRKFYEQKQRNCLGLQQQFYDNSHSWGAALKSVLVSR